MSASKYYKMVRMFYTVYFERGGVDQVEVDNYSAAIASATGSPDLGATLTHCIEYESPEGARYLSVTKMDGPRKAGCTEWFINQKGYWVPVDFQL